MHGQIRYLKTSDQYTEAKERRQGFGLSQHYDLLLFQQTLSRGAAGNTDLSEARAWDSDNASVVQQLLAVQEVRCLPHTLGFLQKHPW